MDFWNFFLSINVQRNLKKGCKCFHHSTFFSTHFLAPPIKNSREPSYYFQETHLITWVDYSHSCFSLQVRNDAPLFNYTSPLYFSVCRLTAKKKKIKSSSKVKVLCAETSNNRWVNKNDSIKGSRWQIRLMTLAPTWSAPLLANVWGKLLSECTLLSA